MDAQIENLVELYAAYGEKEVVVIEVSSGST